MGAAQPGLPVPTALPADSHKIVLDLKDCFFSIPLHPDDCPRFAFSLPVTNCAGPSPRFHWKVLPQGMANSPTLCQVYVASIVDPFRSLYPSVSIYHYMDDLLLASSDDAALRSAATHLVSALKARGFSISSDKVQIQPPHLFLGFELLPAQVKTQKVQLRTSHLKTYHDFQRLMGDITWLRPYLNVPTGELKPLFDILQGDSSPTSPRTLTPEALEALDTLHTAIQKQFLTYFIPDLPLSLIVCSTIFAPTAVLWQNAPLYWIHLPATPSKVLATYPELVVRLLQQGCTTSLKLFGKFPDHAVIPYSSAELSWLLQNQDSWAIFVTAFTGSIDNHYPNNKLLHFLRLHPVVFPRLTKLAPIPGATLVFSDGSSSGTAAVSVNGVISTIPTSHSSAQLVELEAVLHVFRTLPGPFNLYMDSHYIASSIPLLETVPFIKPSSTAFQLFADIQSLILTRQFPFFVSHLRAHTGLPGPISEGNASADAATRPSLFPFFAPLPPTADPFDLAIQAHSLHHLNAQTLRLRFKITREQARSIVKSCKACLTLLPEPHLGTNPRGLMPGSLWQMDVTHHPPFGRLKYIHVSIDTFSGFLCASLHTGESSRDVLSHLFHCFSIMGIPRCLKTDNGPSYTSSAFQDFCTKFGISHKLGIPYNPQGQGIVERSHHTLKSMFTKLTSAHSPPFDYKAAPKRLLDHALFVLNFLTLDAQGKSAADRLWHPSTAQDFSQVLWKDVHTGAWLGPHPVLIWGKGHACVHNPSTGDTRWLPDRLVKLYNPPRDRAPEDLPSSPAGSPPPLPTGNDDTIVGDASPSPPAAAV